MTFPRHTTKHFPSALSTGPLLGQRSASWGTENEMKSLSSFSSSLISDKHPGLIYYTEGLNSYKKAGVHCHGLF